MFIPAVKVNCQSVIRRMPVNPFLLVSPRSFSSIYSKNSFDIKPAHINRIADNKIITFITNSIGATTDYRPPGELAKELKDIHHFALRGINFGDFSTLTAIRAELETLGYTPTNSGKMASIKGTYQEFNYSNEIGLPKNPYVFTSETHLDDNYSQNVRLIM